MAKNVNGTLLRVMSVKARWVPGFKKPRTAGLYKTLLRYQSVSSWSYWTGLRWMPFGTNKELSTRAGFMWRGTGDSFRTPFEKAEDD